MHATVCLLRAGQPRRAGDAAKSGQFIGQFSWVTGDPMGVKELLSRIDEALYNPLTPVAISKLLEMIVRSVHVLLIKLATAPDSDINQTTGSHGSVSM